MLQHIKEPPPPQKSVNVRMILVFYQMGWGLNWSPSHGIAMDL